MCVNIDHRKFRARDRVLGHLEHALRLEFGQRNGSAGRHLEKAASRHPTTARVASRLRTYRRLGSTSSQDPAQKHMSMHHHWMFGTSSSFGASALKSMKPSPKG